MAFNEQHQNPGNPIPSASWNNIIDEIKRLGTAKVDVTGGTVSGALSVQQTLAVTGTAALGGTTVNGTMSVAGRTSLGSGAGVNGSLDVTGTASVTGNASVGGLRAGGGGAPADTAEVAGNLRLGIGQGFLQALLVGHGVRDMILGLAVGGFQIADGLIQNARRVLHVAQQCVQVGLKDGHKPRQNAHCASSLGL